IRTSDVVELNTPRHPDRKSRSHVAVPPNVRWPYGSDSHRTCRGRRYIDFDRIHLLLGARVLGSADVHQVLVPREDFYRAVEGLKGHRATRIERGCAVKILFEPFRVAPITK